MSELGCAAERARQLYAGFFGFGFFFQGKGEGVDFWFVFIFFSVAFTNLWHWCS